MLLVRVHPHLGSSDRVLEEVGPSIRGLSLGRRDPRGNRGGFPGIRRIATPGRRGAIADERSRAADTRRLVLALHFEYRTDHSCLTRVVFNILVIKVLHIRKSVLTSVLACNETKLFFVLF